MITAALEAEINARREDGWRVDVHPADATSRPEFLARHVYELLRRALEAIHGDDDAQAASQVALANRLVEALFEHGAMAADRVGEAARLLIEAADRRGLGDSPPRLPRPTLSFRRTGLLVNGRRDVQIASEIAREIPSADRIDLLCAFVRHSGLRLFRSELEARARAGAQVRVIASVYTGSTERRALDALIALGARVKVSYEIARTRLHAKAWLFHRESGLHTAYIGSSNLTHAAQVDGLEWNVRVSAAENPEVIERFEAMFEQYWQEPEFEDYEPRRDTERLDRALSRQSHGGSPDDGTGMSLLIDVAPKPHQAVALEAERAGSERASPQSRRQGVDLPEVDTVLMLRPTESATVFLQQLGRGLRWAEGKRVLTVLDLVGQVRREYRYDVRYRALLGGTRHQVQRAVEADFPLLPPGCALKLDRIAKETVLRNLCDAVRIARARFADDLRTLGPEARLGEFMHEAGAELEEIYAKPQSGHCFVELRRRAGFRDGAGAFAPSDPLLRAVGRLLHVDDHERLAAWRAILESEGPDPISSLRGREHRLGLMLFAILGGRRQSTSQADRVLQRVRESGELRREINDLLDILDDRIRTVAQPLDEAADVPLASHATYTRDEIVGRAHADRQTRGARLATSRSPLGRSHTNGPAVHHVGEVGRGLLPDDALRRLSDFSEAVPLGVAEQRIARYAHRPPLHRTTDSRHQRPPVRARTQERWPRCGASVPLSRPCPLSQP